MTQSTQRNCQYANLSGLRGQWQTTQKQVKISCLSESLTERLPHESIYDRIDAGVKTRQQVHGTNSGRCDPFMTRASYNQRQLERRTQQRKRRRHHDAHLTDFSVRRQLSQLLSCHFISLITSGRCDLHVIE